MEQIITEFISRFGYAAIFILILLENVLPIVPSEIILTFAGLMSVKSHLSILTLFIIATIASFIGLLILYYICRLISEERLYRFIDRHGKWIKLKSKDLKRANDWFKKVWRMGCIYLSFHTCITCIDYHSSRCKPHECCDIYRYFINRYNNLEFRFNFTRTHVER